MGDTGVQKQAVLGKVASPKDQLLPIVTGNFYKRVNLHALGTTVMNWPRHTSVGTPIRNVVVPAKAKKQVLQRRIAWFFVVAWTAYE